MASHRIGEEKDPQDGTDAVGNVFQALGQELANIQETLRLQQLEAERKAQEDLQQQEADHTAHEAQEQQEAERKIQEAIRLQDQRLGTALQDMERKLREKDDAIRALRQTLEETQKRTTASEGSGSQDGSQRLEGSVETAKPSSPEEPVPREAFPGPSSQTTSGAGHEDAAADEEERERRRVELRIQEVKLKMEKARKSSSLLGEQLFTAVREENLSDVRRFIDCGADVDYPDEIGCTALFKAVFLSTNTHVVWLLLKLGADVNAVNCYGCSALHWAAIKIQGGPYVELLVRAGADVNARDKDGETPLHCAAFRNNEDTVQALLEAGARKDLRPWSGRWRNKTPFEVASSPEVRDQRAVKILLRPR